MNRFILILNFLELASCITGFLYWNKIKDTYWKWFPVYLGIIFLTEIAGEYFLFVKDDLVTNIAIYSYFGIPLQFLFFYWIFYKQFTGTKFNALTLIAVILYLVALVADISYIGKIQFYFESFSYVIGCLLLMIILIVFFIRFVNSNDIIHYKSSIIFWVSLGLLLFYIGTMPFFAYRTKMYNEIRELFFRYWYLQFGLNYLMYLFFMLSFICGKTK